MLLLTDEDDFNALASTVLQGSVDGPVYRLGRRRPSHGVVAPYTGGEVLFDPRLTRYEVGRRYADGARIAPGPPTAAHPLRRQPAVPGPGRRQARPGHPSGPPQPEPGDTMVLLCPAAGGP